MLVAKLAAACLATVHVDYQESFVDGLTVHSVYASRVIDAQGCDALPGDRLYFAAPGGQRGALEIRVNGLHLNVGTEAFVSLSDKYTSLGIPYLFEAQTDGPIMSDAAFMCTRVPDNGPSLFWRDRTLVMRPSFLPDGALQDQEDLTLAMRWAAKQWSQVPGSDFNIVVGEATTQRFVGYDWSLRKPNANIVTTRVPSQHDFYGEWLHKTSAIAMTTVTFIHKTGEIVDADIEINGSPDYQQFDLANTLTHEFGHALGLDHPNRGHERASRTTMYADSSPGEVSKRWLSEDDKEGLRFLYPTGAKSGDCFLSDRPKALGFTILRDGGCSQAGATAWWSVLLAALLGLFRVVARTPHVPGKRSGSLRL